MNRHPLSMLLTPTAPGEAIPGGCDDCHAEQTIKRVGSVTQLTIHHDDTCPVLRAHQARRGPA